MCGGVSLSFTKHWSHNTHLYLYNGFIDWGYVFIWPFSTLDPTHNLAQRILIMYLNCFRMRNKYYFVWLLVESVNNLTGLGFSGYDKDGKAKWDLVTNVHVLDIELATSLRGMISGWNALTANWLRR